MVRTFISFLDRPIQIGRPRLATPLSSTLSLGPPPQDLLLVLRTSLGLLAKTTPLGHELPLVTTTPLGQDHPVGHDRSFCKDHLAGRFAKTTLLVGPPPLKSSPLLRARS